MRVRKRDFLIGAASAATCPRATCAQPDRMKRIGVLLLFAADDPEGQVRVRALRSGLRHLWWREGQDIQIEWRFALAIPIG
jgi:putative ABC transport system substrate-binding protein